MKFNWNQSGMPVALVSRLGARNDFAAYKSVLNDAQNQIMTPVDAEAMARELAQNGGRGREYVEMVQELSASLADARRELEAANRRYERLATRLAQHGIHVEEEIPVGPEADRVAPASEASSDAQTEWEAWNRKFESLLT